MTNASDSLPDDIVALKAMVIVAEAKAASAVADAARATATMSSAEALIGHLKLMIEKLRRELYGSRSERTAKLLDQMELELEDLEAQATEDEIKAEAAARASGTTLVPAYTRKRPVKKPFPAHLPRERVIVPGPTACSCCGSTRLAKLGEDITETLESIPKQWKVIQHVREKFTCRDCEKISQPPAPFHVMARGHLGPSLLAMILYNKYALHQPLNRQSEGYAREGIDLPLSTLADAVGACASVLLPLAVLIGAHVFGGERIHGDETPVPLLARIKTVKARLWTYVRDDKPSADWIRRQRSISSLATARENTPNATWPITVAFYKPMPMPGSAGFTKKTASPAPSPKRHVGPTRGGNSLFLLISLPKQEAGSFPKGPGA